MYMPTLAVKAAGNGHLRDAPGVQGEGAPVSTMPGEMVWTDTLLSAARSSSFRLPIMCAMPAGRCACEEQ